ncbi:hypothetical protein AB0I60_27190 [Actinosynnema sp. NPDC050436]|uniref:hypothetical protein n=1 Tax=Actinosynnema sp. NPDC050436 TaxID=3155659 RepID=UPI0033FA9332
MAVVGCWLLVAPVPLHLTGADRPAAVNDAVTGAVVVAIALAIVLGDLAVTLGEQRPGPRSTPPRV